MIVSFAADEINEAWYFKKGDLDENLLSQEFSADGFEVVDLPHTCNPSGSAEVYREQHSDVSYAGPMCYRRDLMIDESLRGKRLFLRFGAVMLESEVFINGKSIGTHRGGYSAFIFEITDDVEYGANNYVTVKTDNKLNERTNPVSGGYLKFGGITRPMEFIVKDQFCISPLHFASKGVYCHPISVSNEQVDVEVQTMLNSTKSLDGKYEVECSFVAPNGDVVACNSVKAKRVGAGAWSLNVPVTIKNPKLWNGKKNPALYTVEVVLKEGGKIVDKVVETTGFRNVSIDKDKGFFLNGESYPLRGVAHHQSYPGVGSAMRKEHFDHDMEIMNDLGANSARFSHYPHSEYRYELCDKYGVVAYSEIAFIQRFYDTKEFNDNLDQQIQEMIYQLYNHPSIAMWGLYNEILYDEWDGIDGLPIVERINTIAKECDPYRMTSSASWLHGERNDLSDLSAWNRYPGWYWNAYLGDPSDYSWLDQIRADHPNRKLGITEYGGGGAINHFDENRRLAPFSNDQFHPVDFYNYSHEEQWKQIDKRPWLWGTYIWTMTEFITSYMNEGRSACLHDKALVADERDQVKDVYHFYKANWRPDTPVFHLAYKQFTNRLNDCAEVTVYSNLDNATLMVNGVDCGTLKNGDYCIYRWSNIKLKEGDNVIVVSAEVDGVSYTESAVWHYVTDMNDDENFRPIVESGGEWSVYFTDTFNKSEGDGGRNVPPGQEVNSMFWIKESQLATSPEWDTITLPLVGDLSSISGNWMDEKMVCLTKKFTTESDVENPYLYVLQTATKSTGNMGRIMVSIDGKPVYTQEEGCNHYRLIPIDGRLGILEKGEHTITILAAKPDMGARLDVGFYDMVR